MDCANWEGDSQVSFLKVVLKVDLDWNPDSYAMPRIFRCLCWSAPFPSSSPLVLLSSSANIYGCIRIVTRGSMDVLPERNPISNMTTRNMTTRNRTAFAHAPSNKRLTKDCEE